MSLLGIDALAQNRWQLILLKMEGNIAPVGKSHIYLQTDVIPARGTAPDPPCSFILGYLCVHSALDMHMTG